MKLVTIKTIKGQIKVLTGLHIGAGSDAIEIGGMDNPIIRDPATKLPYIPGSSIKGKMRSLMELFLISDKIVNNNGNPCSCGKADCPICRVFGTAVNRNRNNIEDNTKRGPTRLIVRDSFINNEYLEKHKNNTIIEEKSENSFSLLTYANNSSKT